MYATKGISWISSDLDRKGNWIHFWYRLYYRGFGARKTMLTRTCLTDTWTMAKLTHWATDPCPRMAFLAAPFHYVALTLNAASAQLRDQNGRLWPGSWKRALSTALLLPSPRERNGGGRCTSKGTCTYDVRGGWEDGSTKQTRVLISCVSVTVTRGC